MMIYPPITKLVEKTGSRYTLVIEAAKRARQLSEGAAPLAKGDSAKEVSIATNEIFENKLEVFARPTFRDEGTETAEPEKAEEPASSDSDFFDAAE